jgi:hypothetical protein
MNKESAASVHAQLAPKWVPWFEGLTPFQREALSLYKSRDAYLRFAAARGITDPEEAIASLWDALDTAFTSARWDRPAIVWRGYCLWDAPDWTPPSVGCSWEDLPSWASTSLIEGVAANETYAHLAASEDRPILLEVALPAGAQAIYLEPIREDPTHEAEVLLPRTTRPTVSYIATASSFRTFRASHPFSLTRIGLRVGTTP